MSRRVTLALFVVAVAQSQSLFIGRLVDASRTPPMPVPNAKVTILATGQQQLTDPDGVFKLAIPKTFIPGTEIQLDVKAGKLRVYLPLDGVFNLPAQIAKPLTIKLLPAGSKLFLEPAVIESLLAQASKPAPQATRPDPNKKQDEPALQRFIKDWAVKYGFGFEQVQTEVQNWGDQIRANPQNSTLRQQALAAFEAKNFEKSAELFRKSAHEAGSEFDSLDAQSKALEEKKRTALRNYLDDEIRAAESLENRFKFSEAVDELSTASQRAPRDRYPAWWAEMQERIAIASSDAGEKGAGAPSITFLTCAVNAYQSALQVYARDSLPQDWASTQMNLGNAYSDLGERQGGEDGMKSLQASVHAYEQALTVRTKETLPQDWASTQMNLGNAYIRLGERQGGEDGMKSLQASVHAFEQALTVYAKETLPQDWARTQMNLGNAYRNLGERQGGEDGMKSLQASVHAYEQALTVRTKETLPQDWARTQMNLGNAYISLGERQGGEDARNTFLAAIAAYQSALTVFSKDFARDQWANIQNGLAKANYHLQRWQEAATAEELALTLYPEWSDALTRATSIYHEHLFQFERAFELNSRRASLGQNQDDLIENHLTTARFSGCVSKASDRLAQPADPRLKLVVTALRLACLSATPGPPDARTTSNASDIFPLLKDLQKSNRSFAGTKHFISQSPAFAPHSADWVHLFEALEEGDPPKARSALLAIGFHE